MRNNEIRSNRHLVRCTASLRLSVHILANQSEFNPFMLTTHGVSSLLRTYRNRMRRVRLIPELQHSKEKKKRKEKTVDETCNQSGSENQNEMKWEQKCDERVNAIGLHNRFDC